MRIISSQVTQNTGNPIREEWNNQQLATIANYLNPYAGKIKKEIWDPTLGNKIQIWDIVLTLSRQSLNIIFYASPSSCSIFHIFFQWPNLASKSVGRKYWEKQPSVVSLRVSEQVREKAGQTILRHTQAMCDSSQESFKWLMRELSCGQINRRQAWSFLSHVT